MKQSDHTVNSGSLYTLTMKMHWFKFPKKKEALVLNLSYCPIIFSPEKLHIPNIFIVILRQFNFLQTPIEMREIQFVVVNNCYSACDIITEYDEDLSFNFPV